MAQADELQLGEGAVHGGADAAHRVAEVEDPGLRADFLGVGADLQDGRDDAQRVEQPPRAAVLAIHLAHAVLLGNAPILLPKLEAVADLDRVDQKVGPLKRFQAVGGSREGERQFVLFDEFPAILGGDCQGVGVDVVQHDVAAFQHLALQDIPNGAVAELGAAGADQDDGLFHKTLP
jgi:hypothetical protein